MVIEVVCSVCENHRKVAEFDAAHPEKWCAFCVQDTVHQLPAPKPADFKNALSMAELAAVIRQARESGVRFTYIRPILAVDGPAILCVGIEFFRPGKPFASFHWYGIKPMLTEITAWLNSLPREK